MLGIKGENLKGVYSGKDIANWYNAHIDYDKFHLPIPIKNLLIIG